MSSSPVVFTKMENNRGSENHVMSWHVYDILHYDARSYSLSDVMSQVFPDSIILWITVYCPMHGQGNVEGYKDRTVADPG